MPPVKVYRPKSPKGKKVKRVSRKKIGFKRLPTFCALLGGSLISLWTYFNGSDLMDDFSHTAETNLASIGFKLEDVVVEGRKRTDKGQILKALGLERGNSLLAIPLQEAKEKLETFAWIKAARIERKFPNTLYIRISEKEPIALWQHQSKTYLVDRDGELVETKEPYKYKDLLVVTGNQASQHLNELVMLLDKFPKLKPRIRTATHLRAARWDIKLDNRIDIKLPEKDAEQALETLLSLEKHHQLADQEITTIDMRLPGQLILRLTPEAAQRKKTGKDV